ncbi:MAG: hypothetical protein IJZ95_00115 [Oscillospiraceae bacterium]|nr:hypothetical protein [Oscillospiraceae bacterium]
MKAELLGEATYKITLDKTESASMPTDGRSCDMHRFICGIIDRLAAEQGLVFPEGRLLVEAFLRSDGSSVFFVSALEQDGTCTEQRYYSCEITGIEQLRCLCEALSHTQTYCRIYCGSDPLQYRFVFTDPPPDTERICNEYGEYCEISPLFAAQTEEYLTEIASGNAPEKLSMILG